MTDPHTKINDKTLDALNKIRGIASKEEPDTMAVIFAIAYEWHNEYGQYYKTIKNIDNPSAVQSIAWRQAGACSTCGDIREVTLPGKGPHKMRVNCGEGHFKRWK